MEYDCATACVTVCVRSRIHANSRPCLVFQKVSVHLCESDVAYNEGSAGWPFWNHDDTSVCLITVLWVCVIRLTAIHLVE